MAARGGRPGLVGDIGGTNARFALARPDGTIGETTVLASDEHADLAAAATHFLAGLGADQRPRRAAIAVAAVIDGDRVDLTNNDWSFSLAALEAELGLDSLEAVNDFEAIALALPHLDEGLCAAIGGGRAVAGAPMAVLGAGTGLGVAGLVPTADGWRPLTGEGGHVTMAATEAREAAVLAELRHQFDHVSAERVLSGPGLVNLYRALGRIDRRQTEDLAPAEVSARAMDGTCPVAAEALSMFAAMLGTVAADLALMVGARGGIFVAGGIVPRLGAWFAASGFRARFEAKGRRSTYLAAIPTHVVHHPAPALLGLARRLFP